ncbi:hypothetical protein G8935_003101 [Salmonella enterica]|nr:hypothetical protein [Salmonella enterica subsp. enterica serovar Newport]ECB6684910.1 hypothetical protein [Salmonella enterica subsp. enterica serovar Poona]ECC9215380.1 hypothetical protein [Salmonella enterica subsp. enterica]ECD2404465.1 hypothetical protein [Salmonella enterica subsp. enterica serovar Richmond]EEH6201784.1 hypothetical protein [Salmonella enterica]
MFFKTSNPAALAAWDQYQFDCQKVRTEAKELEAALGCGGRALFRVDVAGCRFHGMCFPDNLRPFARELWTVQRATTGWSCEPRRSRIPAHLRALAKELAGVWDTYRPITIARTDALLLALGLDFSATFFGPLEWVRTGDVIYVSAGIKPSHDRMIEILSDEFQAARKQAEAPV